MFKSQTMYYSRLALDKSINSKKKKNCFCIFICRHYTWWCHHQSVSVNLRIARDLRSHPAPISDTEIPTTSLTSPQHWPPGEKHYLRKELMSAWKTINRIKKKNFGPKIHPLLFIVLVNPPELISSCTVQFWVPLQSRATLCTKGFMKFILQECGTVP